MESRARSQSNLVIRNLNGFSNQFHKFSNTIVPMFWAEYVRNFFNSLFFFCDSNLFCFRIKLVCLSTSQHWCTSQCRLYVHLKATSAPSWFCAVWLWLCSVCEKLWKSHTWRRIERYVLNRSCFLQNNNTADWFFFVFYCCFFFVFSRVK